MTRREALRITAVGGAALAFGGLLTREVVRSAKLHRVRETRAHLGTVVTITAVDGDGEAARRVVSAGFQEIERLEALLSRHAPATPMARLNREGFLGAAPAELLHVLGRAGEIHALSGGAFDPTVLPLLRVFELRQERGLGLPTDAEVEAARGLVGFEDVDVTAEGAVRLRRPGAQVTLDGIAKGYVVDRAVARLAEAGAERVMVDAGGDIASAGARVERDPWRIDVGNPDLTGPAVGRVLLAGEAMATSGDYMQAFTRDRRHHHILDPRTGRSPDHASSVTVVARNAMDADALSTAVMVLGPTDGIALLRRVPGAEGLVVTKDGARAATPGFGA